MVASAIAFNASKEALGLIRVPDAEIDSKARYTDLWLHHVSPCAETVGNLDLKIAVSFGAYTFENRSTATLHQHIVG
jgi:hypothetical protein